MASTFIPKLHAMLIGSMPFREHPAALDLVLEYCPHIPNWVQLPVFEIEQMIPQFAAGMPGLRREQAGRFVDTASPDFDDELLAFYEDYLAAAEATDLAGTRFTLSAEDAGGFFALRHHLESRQAPPIAVKGQITGPITLATGMKERSGRAIFYDDRTRDAAVKLLAQNARWQIQQLSQAGAPVIIFIDEPALAGVGSSELISISTAQIHDCLAEVVDTVHAAGGLAGIHVCANTDWAVVLGCGVDIVNFDAYNYFEKFALYGDDIKRFLGAGGILAWGIVPTLNPEDIDAESVDRLYDRWQSYRRRLEEMGISRQALEQQSLITPSCGMGTLDVDRVYRVLEMTRGLSDRLRKEAGFRD